MSLLISSPKRFDEIGVDTLQRVWYFFFKLGLIIYLLRTDKWYCTWPNKINESDRRDFACLFPPIWGDRISASLIIGVNPDATKFCMSTIPLSWLCVLLSRIFQISWLTLGGHALSQFCGTLYFEINESVSHWDVQAMFIKLAKELDTGLPFSGVFNLGGSQSLEFISTVLNKAWFKASVRLVGSISSGVPSVLSTSMVMPGRSSKDRPKMAEISCSLAKSWSSTYCVCCCWLLTPSTSLNLLISSGDSLVKSNPPPAEVEGDGELATLEPFLFSLLALDFFGILNATDFAFFFFFALDKWLGATSSSDTKLKPGNSSFPLWRDKTSSCSEPMISNNDTECNNCKDLNYVLSQGYQTTTTRTQRSEQPASTRPKRFLLSRREQITCPKRIVNLIHAKHSGVMKIMSYISYKKATTAPKILNIYRN